MVESTQLPVGGGCAAKYPAARLEELLRGFVPAESENLLVGLSPADDAAVYRLDDERALVFTVDFFPPIVDDPHDFGAIAATNALNDVFAMGGTPLLALSVAAFPEELPVETLGAILAGAEEQVRAAGALLAGGHTIRDTEPKYGLAVVGTVHPDAIWPKSGARPGDALLLTKPLGTGLVTAAFNAGELGREERDVAVELMRTLNRDAADALRPFEPNAVTDVTGFGLFGHAHELAERSGVGVRITADRMPMLPGALEAARAGVRTGGDRRNREFAGPHVTLTGVPDDLAAIGYDPQTAGGLLVSLPSDRVPILEAEFAARGLFVRRIGAVEQGSGVRVQRRGDSLEPVAVVDYDPRWPTEFERLRARAAAALGDLAVAIEHVGSTAVPGLAAKPVIDLDVVVRRPEDVAHAIERLASIGYVHSGDLGLPGREAFAWPEGEERHHLYVCAEGAEPLRLHLALRDHLRSHPEDAARYAAVKRELAARHRHDRIAYTDGKDEVIREILARAELA